jgi:hypothetical protein
LDDATIETIILNSSIEILINLYQSDKNFKRVLDNQYILNKLKRKFNRWQTIESFPALVESVIGTRPGEFGIGKLPYPHSDYYNATPITKNKVWNEIARDRWLDKLYTVEKFSPEISKKRVPYSMAGPAILFSGNNFNWDNDYYVSVSHNIIIPSKDFYDYINDLYRKGGY